MVACVAKLLWRQFDDVLVHPDKNIANVIVTVAGELLDRKVIVDEILLEFLRKLRVSLTFPATVFAFRECEAIFHELENCSQSLLTINDGIHWLPSLRGPRA